MISKERRVCEQLGMGFSFPVETRIAYRVHGGFHTWQGHPGQSRADRAALQNETRFGTDGFTTVIVSATLL